MKLEKAALENCCDVDAVILIYRHLSVALTCYIYLPHPQTAPQLILL